MMKKTLLAALAVLMVAAPASARVVSVRVCQDKALAASGADTYGLGNGIADCTYTDISEYRYFSFQISCADANSTDYSVDVDWIGGSGASAAFMGVPILNSGAAMTQLKTALTQATVAEGAWSVLQTIQPPVSPVGTIRITNNSNESDETCTVILNMGN